MSRLTSQQRKLVYFAIIVVLLAPIIVLGIPATGEEGSGGMLAEMRQRYQLGESTLGDIDPTSVTMNLVLLGFRGLAVNQLWLQADEQKNTKNWAQMRATTDSIITLQPHYKDVWRFHGWNLAYNVSAEWDSVRDRFYWVKEGAKFTADGTRRNRFYPELYFDVGKITGAKVGRSDEWRYFRDFFMSDPDPKFDGGPDPVVNPDNKDNYLVAKDWFTRANEIDETHPQRMMMDLVFRQNPAHSQLAYSDALQREGIFDEVTRIAWEQGFNDWTQDFGQELFETPGGQIRLEATPEELRDLAEQQDVDLNLLVHWQNRYRRTCSYLYWRVRALAAAEPETVAGYREMYEGKQLFKQHKLRPARRLLESGMEKYAKALERHPLLTSEDLSIEQAMMAVLYWRYIYQLLGETPPDDFPLKDIWEIQKGRLPSLTEEFRRETGLE